MMIFELFLFRNLVFFLLFVKSGVRRCVEKVLLVMFLIVWNMLLFIIKIFVRLLVLLLMFLFRILI